MSSALDARSHMANPALVPSLILGVVCGARFAVGPHAELLRSPLGERYSLLLIESNLGRIPQRFFVAARSALISRWVLHTLE